MTICRKCGTSNQDGRKFCVFCHELLVADPVEMEKRATAENKKNQKLLKRLEAKHKRWKKALLLLIPVGVLDFIDLLLCLDLAFIGLGGMLGQFLGELAANMLGPVIELMGVRVYTALVVAHTLRGLEFFAALALLLIACVLCVIMIVRMIKWRVYRQKGDKKEEAIKQAAQAKHSSKDAHTEQDGMDMPVREQSVDEVKAAVGEHGVSYALLSQACEHRKEYTSPAPTAQTDCKQLFDSLMLHLWEYDEDSVRRILSAMSASRMLLCSAGALDGASIFDNLLHAFGVNAEQFSFPEPQDGEPAGNVASILIERDGKTGELTHTSFTKALYTAKFSPKNVCLAGVSGVGAGAAEAVFSPFIPYFGLPESNIALYLGAPAASETKLPDGIIGGKMVLPHNVWVINVLPDYDHDPCVGKTLARYAAAIYLRNSGMIFPPESADGAQTVAVSIDAWERAVAAAENDSYLSDESWKILDQLEQQMVEVSGEGLSNRTLRMFEKYTSVFMACGGKQSDAFDNGFAAVIIPACAPQLQALADREEGETLAALLERTAGRERLPMTVEVLASMGLI